MKIDRLKLLKELQFVGLAGEKRSTIPVLETVRFVVEKDVHLTVTNLDLTAETSLEFIEADPTSFCVNTQDITNALKASTAEVVEVILEKARAVITCGKNTFRLAFVEIEQYPQTPDFKDAVELPLQAHFLRRGLALTSYAASNDASQYTIGVVNIINNGKLSFWAIDGYMGAHLTSKEAVSGPEIETMLPLGAVRSFITLCDENRDVTLLLDRNHIGLKAGKKTVTSRLLSSKAPNISMLRQENADHNFEFVVEDLAAVTRAGEAVAGIIKDSLGRFTNFRLEPQGDDELSVSSRDDESEFTGTCAVTIREPFNRISVNGEKLRKHLSVLPGDLNLQARITNNMLYCFADVKGFDGEFFQVLLTDTK